MAVNGHQNEASIRSYNKTNICRKTKISETLTTICEVGGDEFTPVIPILSLSQVEVIINISRSEITKNLNFEFLNVSIQ